MEKKEITKFPKGFFQMSRKVITASEAVKDVKPFEWEKIEKGKTKEKVVKNTKKI